MVRTRKGHLAGMRHLLMNVAFDGPYDACRAGCLAARGATPSASESSCIVLSPRAAGPRCYFLKPWQGSLIEPIGSVLTHTIFASFLSADRKSTWTHRPTASDAKSACWLSSRVCG